jgi:hypothetical protein
MAQANRGFDNPGQSITFPLVRPMSDDQDRFVKDLFKHYAPEELSAEDAVEIIEALAEAGIRGPAVRALVVTAGLDPQKFIRQVDSEAVSRQLT